MGDARAHVPPSHRLFDCGLNDFGRREPPSTSHGSQIGAMKIDFKIIHLQKKFPLRISRGVITGSDNLFVSVTRDAITGWGEMAPGSSEGVASATEAQTLIEGFCQQDLTNLSVRKVHALAIEQQLPPCALAALDIAQWDWLAKQANLPLYQLLGMPKPTVPTSVTIGINPPDVIRERVPLLLGNTDIRSLKIKLGSPQGIDADKAMFSQVVDSAKGYDVTLRVDANGGWDVDQARQMMQWLAQRGTEYVEQPLKEGHEDELPAIFAGRPLPIFVDESCRFAPDIPPIADCVDGVNLKLMKCGGITGALQIIEVARAHKLETMIGCMGESSLSISAGAALTGLLDHVDLDSHLNLAPDPCVGATLINGVMMPNNLPGHGATFVE